MSERTSSGYLVADDEGSPLGTWEALAVDAVGGVIEFWGFKRNQGRLWALLYLRDVALSATELQTELEPLLGK